MSHVHASFRAQMQKRAVTLVQQICQRSDISGSFGYVLRCPRDLRIIQFVDALEVLNQILVKLNPDTKWW